MLGFVVCRRDAGACGKRQRTGGLIMHQEYTKLYTINPASYRRVSLRKRCYGDLLAGGPRSATQVAANPLTAGESPQAVVAPNGAPMQL
jgi:hypothetical protein